MKARNDFQLYFAILLTIALNTWAFFWACTHDMILFETPGSDDGDIDADDARSGDWGAST